MLRDASENSQLQGYEVTQGRTEIKIALLRLTRRFLQQFFHKLAALRQTHNQLDHNDHNLPQNLVITVKAVLY